LGKDLPVEQRQVRGTGASGTSDQRRIFVAKAESELAGKGIPTPGIPGYARVAVVGPEYSRGKTVDAGV